MSGHEDQFSSLWSSVKVRYKDTTGEDLDDASFPHPTSLEDLRDSVDAQNQGFSRFREKRGAVFRVLDAACKPIELVGNMAGGAAEMAFPPSSLCFGAVTYLINAAHGVSESYDAIIELLEKLKAKKLAEILVTLIEIFARSTKVIKSGSKGRLLQYAKNVLVGKDEKLEALVSKWGTRQKASRGLKTDRTLDNVSSIVTETGVVTQESHVMIKDIDLGVHRITITQDDFRQEMRQELRTVVTTLNESKTEAKSDRDNKHLEKTKLVLKPSVNPIDTFTDISKKRVPETGDWIRTEPLFLTWMKRDNPILWISGIPGSGKSFLSGNIVMYLEEQQPQGVQHPSHTSVAYYFFKDSDPQTRSVHQALRDLAHQISSNDPVYEKHVVSQCQSSDDIKTIQSAWRKLFVDFFLKNEKIDSSVYLVLDGLDEADPSDRQLLFEALTDVKNTGSDGQRKSRINIVLVGRPEVVDEISLALEGPVPSIYVEGSKNGADIVHYLRNSIKKSKVLSRAPKALQEEIVEVSASNANGMFIWVDFMMRELSKCNRASTIRDCLYRAPKGLSQMLRHVLETFSTVLKEEDPDDLNSMLAWVTCAARPLSLGELDTTLKLKSPEGDGVLYIEGKLRKQFASFFVLTREDGLSTADLQGDLGTTLALDKDEHPGDEEEGLDDVENETDFDSNPLTTDVTFCHASIGDFFRDERQGKVAAEGDNPAVGVNILEARVLVLKTCLKVLCDPSFSSKVGDSPSMEPYAYTYWHDHLQAVTGDLARLDASDKAEIGRLLIKMLRDEAVIDTWVGQKTYYFFTTENLEVLHQWLRSVDAPDVMSPDDQQWLQSSLHDTAAMLAPTLDLVARKWLQHEFWDPVACMRIIHSAQNGLDAGQMDSFVLISSPLQVILEAAEKFGFEKTPLWHRRLAMCLRDSEHYDEAMEHFEIALKMNERLWMARSGIARLHAQREHYDEAIRLGLIVEEDVVKRLDEQKRAAEDVADPVDKQDLSICQEELAGWYSSKNDSTNAVKYYRQAFDNWNCEYQNLFQCITHLRRQQEIEEFETVMELLRGMEDQVPGKDYTRLTECIWTYNWSDEDFFATCAKAAMKTHQLAWLQNAYEMAINGARKELKSTTAITLEVCLADLYSKYGHEEEKAFRHWSRVLEAAATAGAMSVWQMNYCKELVTRRFGPFCLQKALDAGDGTSEAAVYVRKLESMCKQKTKAIEDAPQVITTNYAAVFLGLWHRRGGRDREARACFQPFIKEALMILSDDDPDNDSSGYYQLAHVLLATGDDVNALAVLHTLRPTPKVDATPANEETAESPEDASGETTDNPSTDDSNRVEADGALDAKSRETVIGIDNARVEEPSHLEPDTATNSPEETETTQTPIPNPSDRPSPQTDIDDLRQNYPEDPFTYPWWCDGPCKETFPTYTHGNVCQICLCDLCDDCLKLVKADVARDEEKICHPQHEWFHVDPPGQKVEEGELLVGDEVVTLEEFKERLRREWEV
ncbi:MAG: hypothetical protein M1817_001216 [Caeruleum heppii]|nr:MAG: hypothetical protein M1817_001216 [Caeruleum heppii]